MFKMLLAGFALIVFVGCSDEGVGSCDLETVAGYCQTYTGGGYDNENILPSIEQACTSGGGAWVDSCHEEQSTGTCVTGKDTLNEMVITYYANQYPTVDDARAACEFGVGGNAPGGGEFHAP